MHSRAQLADDLRALGVRPGDVLMVHASIRAVGQVAGGPDQIHLAIKDAVTDRGTMFMYANAYEHYGEVGRGHLSPELEAEILEKLPPFDADKARATRDNGYLVELFRSYGETRVNQHVARFVVWGAHTDYLLSEQPWDMAFGRGSVLDRFVELDGKILLLGSDHDNVTFLHYAEHIGDFPNKRIARYKVPVLDNGQRVWRDQMEVDTGSGAHENWPEHFFRIIVDGYLARTGNTGGRVGNAQSYLIPARGLLDYALPIMVRVATEGWSDDVLEQHSAKAAR